MTVSASYLVGSPNLDWPPNPGRQCLAFALLILLVIGAIADKVEAALTRVRPPPPRGWG